MNIGILLSWSKEMLDSAGIENSSIEARMLLGHGIKKDPVYILTNKEHELSSEEEALIKKLVEKRSRRIPIQYITGEAGFMSLSFKVNDDVLIPRMETELLVEEVLKYVERNPKETIRILDLCTGSGCIAVSLVRYSGRIEADAADISMKALEIAEINAKENNVSGRIDFIQSDLFEQIRSRYDVIVSNPPYIRTRVIKELQKEVKDHEPYIALDGGEDGLLYYRRIIAGCRDHLNKDGALFLETGYDQANEVSSLMKEDFTQIKIIKDYSGNDRIVSGKIKS